MNNDTDLNISLEVDEPLATVSRKRLEQVMRNIKRDFSYPESEIPFELIIGSLFPTLFKNFTEKLKKEYEQGYMDGLSNLRSEEE